MNKTILVCCGNGCKALGGEKVLAELQYEAEKLQALSGSVIDIRPIIKPVGCSGFCSHGPVVEIIPDEITYYHVKEIDARDIIQYAMFNDTPIQRLLFPAASEGSAPLLKRDQNPFFMAQERLALSLNGKIDPSDILDYLEKGGYRGLANALNRNSKQIISRVAGTTIRDRNDGYPLAAKWRKTAATEISPKFIICNAEGSLSGSIIHRTLLESNPHAVLEGISIAALAVGAENAFVHLPAIYEEANNILTEAIAQANERNLLGNNILSTGKSIDIKIAPGGEGILSGTEYAALAAIEGQEINHFDQNNSPGKTSIWGYPAVCHSVETFALLPGIMAEGGANAFAAIGTKRDKGTKIVSLTGQLKTPGVMEIPLGTTIKEIISQNGGGMKDGRHIKAVHFGGELGSLLLPGQLDFPLDFINLKKYSSANYPAGIIILDQYTCMVDYMRRQFTLFAKSGCWICTSCREGLRRILHILTNICAGDGSEKDIKELKGLGRLLSLAAACPLGEKAGNLLSTTIEHFYKEYETHIYDKFCPAGTCKKITKLAISSKTCRSCGRCKNVCPLAAIDGSKGKPCKIWNNICDSCGLCREVCPTGAIRVANCYLCGHCQDTCDYDDYELEGLMIDIANKVDGIEYY